MYAYDIVLHYVSPLCACLWKKASTGGAGGIGHHHFTTSQQLVDQLEIVNFSLYSLYSEVAYIDKEIVDICCGVRLYIRPYYN